MGSAVIWSWGMNAIRLGFGLLVLPLLVLLLPTKQDLGFYQLLTNLVVVVPLLDVGLSFGIERGLSFAMGGAAELKPHGVHLAVGGGRPNEALLWRIVHAAKMYYSALAAVGFVGLGAVGSWLVVRNADQTSNPTLCWVSLGIAVANAGFEIYAGWWATVLRGVNGMPTSAHIGFFAHGLKLVLSCVLLLAGAGLASVFAAGFVSSFVLRFLSRRAALRLLPPPPERKASWQEIVGVLRVLWPNSWRVGLQVLSSFLTTLLLSVLCTEFLDLADYQAYGLSIQVANIIQGISAVWVTVKWPLVGQLRARHDHDALRRLLRPRFWLQAVTFVVVAVVAGTLGPYLLSLLRTDKQLLPHPWLTLILIQGFIDLQVSFWTFLLATENRVPSLWPMVCTYAVTLLLTIILSGATTLGVGVFALAPFLASVAFNFWYWPVAGAQNLRTSWWRFIFARVA
jgi:hypothetical protein